MDQKVSYTKLVDVEYLEAQKEGPQVVNSKTVGVVRGFFITVAALSLTIFIGLVVVVVIKDINDQPRRSGYYGHSPAVSRRDGCRFNLMSLDWMRPGCHDEEVVEGFRDFGPGDWFTDTDFGLDCEIEEVHAGAEESP
jgi:hypothetical protein